MTNPKPIEPPVWASSIHTDEHGTVATASVAGVSFRMRWVEPGTFTMGSSEDEDGRYEDEAQHQVTLTHGYWLAETQCTQALWQAVMGTDPSRFSGDQHPVECVSWDDCQAFVAKANALVPGLALRLPTEAEWEYACRAGTTDARYGDLNDIAWCVANSGGTTHPVGQKVSNAWGLYDTLGNVWEWCEDWFGEYGASHAAADPTGPECGVGRVLRGGSWIGSARFVRSACRLHFAPAGRGEDYGVRFARGQGRAGEPCERLRRDGAGECRATDKIELPEGWERHADCSFSNRDRIFNEGDAIEPSNDMVAFISRRSIDRPTGRLCIPDTVLAAYLQAKGWGVTEHVIPGTDCPVCGKNRAGEVGQKRYQMELTAVRSAAAIAAEEDATDAAMAEHLQAKGWEVRKL